MFHPAEYAEHSTEWFGQVMRWSHLLAQQRSEEELLELVLRIAAQDSSAQQVALFLRDRVPSACGRVTSTQGDWAFWEDEPPEAAAQAAARLFEAHEREAGVVPLEHEGETLGALVFLEGGPSGHLPWLLPHMSVALVNSQLYASLEQLVEHEMMTVVQREESIRLILDSMQEGLLVISLEGAITETQSRAISTWFGQVEEGQPVAPYLFPDAPVQQEMFDMGLEAIAEGFMPFEVLVEQLPSTVERGGRTYRLSFERVFEAGELTQLLIVARDVTDALEAARAERALRELTAVVQIFSQQPDEFLRFMEDMDRLVQRMREVQEAASLARTVHTLKGNAGLMGLSSFAQACHQVETDVVAGELRWEDVAGRLLPTWEAVRARLAHLLPRQEDERRYLCARELEDLRRLSQHGPRGLRDLVEHLDWDPFEKIVSRCSREVRRVARRQGKLCEIRVVGGELRVSPKISRFAMTLVHVARNAVDHGLETPEEREDKGKPRVGVLRWSLEERAYHSILSVADDGVGVDWCRAREVAQERGLACDTPQALTDALLSDGFSTAREVSQVSGRGIGMSAVLEELRHLGGHLEVRSQRDQGTRWSFILPKQA
jgi:two-component system chemotaxis sensor kinase CheA